MYSQTNPLPGAVCAQVDCVRHGYCGNVGAQAEVPVGGAGAAHRFRRSPTLRHKEGAIRKFTVNLLGAAALVAAGYALLRQGNPRTVPEQARSEEFAAGEKDPGKIRLDKLRELGI